MSSFKLYYLCLNYLFTDKGKKQSIEKQIDDNNEGQIETVKDIERQFHLSTIKMLGKSIGETKKT